MSNYSQTAKEIWTGRQSDQQLYLHEKVAFVDIEKNIFPASSTKNLALLAYACDEGVKRNQGRIGAVDGPDQIRKQLAKMPNHLLQTTNFIDAGSISCVSGNMEAAQENLAKKVTSLLENNYFPMLIGGGHDIAYGHYNGIKNYVAQHKTIGIINFDAHFDLRSNSNGNNSGTPFYQIAQDCKSENMAFNYLCLGIRKDANNRVLFQTASDFGVRYIEQRKFNTANESYVHAIVCDFIKEIDYIYVTIDLDGFSSAYAPGVSAASSMGFAPDIVLQTLELLSASKKLISIDIAEMNPKYDVDHKTEKLAASLLFDIMHNL